MAEPVLIGMEGTLVFRRFRSDDSGRWIGVCDALGIAVEAETPDELRSVTAEALDLLMADLAEDNELEDFLRDRRLL